MNRKKIHELAEEIVKITKAPEPLTGGKPKCPLCHDESFVGTIGRHDDSDETVLIDGYKATLFLCHTCDQYFVTKIIEVKKVYMLEVRNKGQNPHFQAIFVDVSLAYQARDKYLNDPACKRDLMEADIHAHKVHTDLTILDPYRKLEE